MFPLDSCSPKKSIPILIALLVVAQIDLASAAGWPGGLLSLLHLTPAPDVHSRAFCVGLGSAIDFVAVFQIIRICVQRTLQSGRNS